MNNLCWAGARLLAIALINDFDNELELGECHVGEWNFSYDVKLSREIHERDLELLDKAIRRYSNQGIAAEVVPLTEISLTGQGLKRRYLSSVDTSLWRGLIIRDKTGKVLLEDICSVDELAHISSVSLDHFQLTSISSAFFMGSSKNVQLIRISGVAAYSQEGLEAILHKLRERHERDHKIIGRTLEIYAHNHLFGQGLPAWLEDGAIIRRKIHDVVREQESKHGFEEVVTPIFGRRELYETSGHLQHYKDSMFPIIKLEHEELILRPMTCPHHILLFNSRRWSHRDLPKRYCENSRLYRREASGALSGLERVRAMELTDGHIFLRVDQKREEVGRCYRMIAETLAIFGIKISHVSLSTRDVNKPEKFVASNELWDTTEELLRACVQEMGIDYIEEVGEAAFYGPKLDIQIKNFLDKELTISTIQLDFLLPQRFNTCYINQNNTEEQCVMIHRGLIGTYERFISILLEQYKGILPFWLSPRQVTIIPISAQDEKLQEYSEQVYARLRDANIHVAIDLGEERLNKKILRHQQRKVQMLAILGRREVADNTVTIRCYGSSEIQTYPLEKFITMIVARCKNRE